jgi:hypothetical protein
MFVAVEAFEEQDTATGWRRPFFFLTPALMLA